MASGVICIINKYQPSSIGCSSVFAQWFDDLRHPYHQPFMNCYNYGKF